MVSRSKNGSGPAASSGFSSSREADDKEEGGDLTKWAAVSWILKDLGWCLLCWPVAFGAGMLAIFLEGRNLAKEYAGLSETTAGQVVHNAALCMWLCGNFVWMSGEFLFEDVPEKGRRFPWFDAPLLSTDLSNYWRCVMVARTILTCGALVLTAFYVYCLLPAKREQPPAETRTQNGRNRREEEEERHRLIWGIRPQTYVLIFTGPWILKDICWTFDALFLGLIFCAIVIFLTLDCYRRFGSYIFLAESCWVMGNAVWLCSEAMFHDRSHLPRLSGASFLVAGLSLVIAELCVEAGHLPGEQRPLAKQ